MAKWFTFDELLLAAQRTGRPYKVLAGAKDRCRCCSGPHNPNGPFIRPLGPLIGFGRHITAGGLGGRSMERYCWDILINDPAVPFKCQMAVEPGNGTLWILGTGRANHILNMSQQAYDAIVGGTMALDQFCQNLRGSALVGSTHLLGYEQVAAVAPDAEQSLSTDLHMAELAKMRGWTGVDVAGHGEVALDRGPGDPNEHMGLTRTRISKLVAGGSTPPPPPPPPVPVSTQESPMWLFSNKAGAVLISTDTGVRLVQNTSDLATLEALGVKYGPADSDNRGAYRGMDDGPFALIVDLHGGIVPVARASDPLAVASAVQRFGGVDSSPAAPVDDVQPRKSEAESDAYESQLESQPNAKD